MGLFGISIIEQFFGEMSASNQLIGRNVLKLNFQMYMLSSFPPTHQMLGYLKLARKGCDGDICIDANPEVAHLFEMGHFVDRD